MFNKSLLKRNDKVKSLLTKKDGRIDCARPIRVLFPTRYLDIGFAKIEMDVECLGINIIIDEDYNYVVSKLPNLIKYSPNQIEEVEIDKVSYTLMSFDDNTFITSDSVIDMADPVYEELVEFFMKGNVPFFLSREDIIDIFTKSTITTSKKVGLDPTRISALIAVTARAEDGKTELRLTDKKPKEIRWVSMLNADLAYSNNMSRFMGSYQDRGTTAALNDDNPIKSDIEKIFRS